MGSGGDDGMNTAQILHRTGGRLHLAFPILLVLLVPLGAGRLAYGQDGPTNGEEPPAPLRSMDCPNGTGGAINAPMSFEIGAEHETPRIMLAVGSIEESTPTRLRTALREAGWVDEVWFHSMGGDAIAGLELGRILRTNGVATKVPPGANCFSACSYAFLGGLLRTIDPGACYGVHMFSFLRMANTEAFSHNIRQAIDTARDLDDYSEAVESIHNEILKVEQQAARTARARARYLTEMSISLQLMLPAFETASDDQYWLSNQEMEKYNVVNVAN